MSEEATRIWAPVAAWYRENNKERDWNDLSAQERGVLKVAYYVMHPPTEESRDRVAEIDTARMALRRYERKSSQGLRPSATETRLYNSLKGIVELIDGSKLPAFDKRDMAKAFREGARAMGESYRQIPQNLPNPYTEGGSF